MAEDDKKVSPEDLACEFYKVSNVKELVEPFIIFQVVTNEGVIVWNELRKDELRCLEWSKEEVEKEDKEFPMKGYKRMLIWERLRKKYVNTIPNVATDECHWFYYIKL